MNSIWLHLFLNFIIDAPELIGDAESVYAAIAHGEGGVEKLENAAAALLKLANDLAKAAVAAHP